MARVKLSQAGYVRPSTQVGDELDVSDAVAARLMDMGVAQEVKARRASKSSPPQPDAEQPDAEAQVLADTNVDDVIEKVTSGEWDAARVLTLERAGKNRSTLVPQLEELTRE